GVIDEVPPDQSSPAIICAVGRRLDQLGEDGIRRLEDGLRRHPADFWLHFSLGTMGKRRIDARIGACRAALAIRPNTPAVLNNLGIMHAAKKEYAAAVDAYQQAIRLDPNYVMPHYNLGVAHAARKEYTAAIDSFQKAIGLDAKLALPHNGLGSVYQD